MWETQHKKNWASRVILKDAGTTGQFRLEVGRRAAIMCPVVVLKDDGIDDGTVVQQSGGDEDSDTLTGRRDSVIQRTSFDALGLYYSAFSACRITLLHA